MIDREIGVVILVVVISVTAALYAFNQRAFAEAAECRVYLTRAESASDTLEVLRTYDYCELEAPDERE